MKNFFRKLRFPTYRIRVEYVVGNEERVVDSAARPAYRYMPRRHNLQTNFVIEAFSLFGWKHHSEGGNENWAMHILFSLTAPKGYIYPGDINEAQLKFLDK